MELLLHSNSKISFFKILNDGDYLVVQDNVLKIIDQNTKEVKREWEISCKNFNNAIQMSDDIIFVCTNNRILQINPKNNEIRLFEKDIKSIYDVKKDCFIYKARYLYFYPKEKIRLKSIMNVIYMEDVDKILLILVNGIQIYDDYMIPGCFHKVRYMGDYRIATYNDTSILIYDVKNRIEIKRIQKETICGCIDNKLITLGDNNRNYKLYNNYGELLFSRFLTNGYFSIIEDCLLIKINDKLYKKDIFLENEELILEDIYDKPTEVKNNLLYMYDYDNSMYIYRNVYELPPK